MSKNYVVVGGSHGIGLEIVRRLVDTGGKVTVLSRTSDALTGMAEVNAVSFDVISDPVPADQLPESINGLAYCPGSINLGPIRGIKADAMVDDFQLNAVGAVKCLQACLPAMKTAERSAMVLFSTVAVAQGLSLHSQVAAVKGAVEGLTRSFAAELAPHVRVNCIAPALTDTPLSAKFLSSEEKRNALADKYPLKRVGEAEDIAAMAAYLLSDQAGWVTGQVFGVDGGMSALRV